MESRLPSYSKVLNTCDENLRSTTELSLTLCELVEQEKSLLPFPQQRCVGLERRRVGRQYVTWH